MNIIATSGGINWTWYHWLELDLDKKTVHQTRADRFHKWDELQGAGQHPQADWELQVYTERGCMPDWWKQLTANLPACDKVAFLSSLRGGERLVLAVV